MVCIFQDKIRIPFVFVARIWSTAKQKLNFDNFVFWIFLMCETKAQHRQSHFLYHIAEIIVGHKSVNRHSVNNEANFFIHSLIR